jgi:hypothetical protein
MQRHRSRSGALFAVRPHWQRKELTLAGKIALIARHAATVFLALIILFEEWGWEPLSRLVGKISRLPILARLELVICALPPYSALAVLALPWVFLLPLKILTLWLLATGQLLLATVAIVAGKVLGTAVVARLFALTKPSLMHLRWFESWYSKWIRFKSRVIAQAQATETWARMGAFKNRIRRAMYRWRKAL